MKPLPPLKLSHSNVGGSPASQRTIDLKLSSSPDHGSGSQPPACTLHRIYPWLFTFSTAVAGVFCFLYLTKPFVQPTQNPPLAPSVPALAGSSTPLPLNEKEPVRLMPSNDGLPGESKTAVTNPLKSRRASPLVKSPTDFEQTNLRIQHIITAEAPGGYQAKIDLEVPVLYRSRNLRWTNSEVTRARKLLVQLRDYQEKARNLRLEGIELQGAWSNLIEASIPASDLRADSPTLITNQRDASFIPPSPELNPLQKK